MLGVVLCGGQSSRMGTDKGLIIRNGISFAQSAYAKFETIGLEAVVSINSSQKQAYAQLFPPQKLIIDDPALPIKGPLSGIINCHRQNPAEHLFVLACDLPLMTPDPLQFLLGQSRQFPSYGVCLFLNNHEPEPLCALYSSGALANVWHQHQSGTLHNYSLKKLLAQLKVLSIELPRAWAESFKNFNTPDDVK